MMDCRPRTISICTCVTSLVVRVMRLAVEKRPISSMENDCTLENSFLRRVAPKFVATRAASTATPTDESRLPSAHRSIFPPASRMLLTRLPSVWTSVVISFI